MNPLMRHTPYTIRHTRGLTLIELLVTIAVIGIVSAIAFPAFRVGNETLALDRAAQKLAQDMRKAAQMTLRGEDVACPTAGHKVFGYGVHLDTGTGAKARCYLLWAECGDPIGTNSAFNGGGETCASTSAGDPDGIVERVALEQGIKIESLSGGGSPMNILFLPPYPSAVLNGSEGFGDTLTVTLSAAADSSQTRTITITQRGVVTIQ